MVQRLVVVAHGRAGSAGDPIFGDQGPLVAGASIAAVDGRIQRWVSGPELACRESARQLGGRAEVLPELAGPDLGRWAGRRLSVVAAEDPDGLQAWLSRPSAAPHGGESLVAALARIGAALDGTDWPEGRTVVVVTPAVARLLAVHGMGGPPELGFRLDVRFGGRFELSYAGRGWRLVLG